MQERVAKLAGGVAVIKVGAATEVEMKHKKARVEDALHATRAAVEEGVVPGGGVAYVRALEAVNKASGINHDQDVGIAIVHRALEEPLRQIVANAGEDSSVVLNKVVEGSGNFGYNAATDEYGDMIAMGILDPTKVVRTALQNAVSIAGLMVTTEAMVAEIPEEKKDAMPGGGEIRISTENVQVDDDYAREHSDATVGSCVCRIVSDEGSGMDKQTLSHIFDPFFSTKSGKEGTGLGLSVVYGIVSQHGGWIDADSSPGRGAVFRVFIPAMPMEREQEPGVQGLVEDLKGNGERVLLVEDESAVRALANRLLSEHGYQVYAAGDADEAGSIFEKEKGDFDLVFSDVVLPGEDGISFVGRLRRQRPELRVLLASGYSGDETNRVEIEQHGYRFMQKPYSLKVLMKTIKDVLGDTNS